MQLFFALGHVGIAALASWQIGRWLLGKRFPFSHEALRMAAHTSVGLLLLSHFIFALSALHLISKLSLRLLLGALSLLAVYALIRSLIPWTSRKIYRLSRSSVDFSIILFGCFLFTVWIIFCATVPATDRDEMIYHLEVPKLILQNHGLYLPTDNFYSYFPQLMEMLFVFGMGLAGEVAAKLYHVLAGVLVCFAIYGFSRRSLSRGFSLLAAILFMTVPSVMAAWPLAYVDLLYTLYAFLALICLLDFFETGKYPSVLLCGLFTGAAASTKYPGLALMLLFALIISLEYLSSKRKDWWKATLTIGLCTALIPLPYFIRNWVFTGWPLFPFNPLSFFALNPLINWDVTRSSLYLSYIHMYGTTPGQETIWNSLFAPVLVFLKGQFNQPENYEGVLSPVFFLTPILLLFAKKDKAIKWLSFWTVLFLFWWAFNNKQIRFLIPMLPALCFLLSYGLAQSRSRMAYLITVFFISIGIALGYGELMTHQPLSYWLGKESKEAYLTRLLRGYPIFQEANKRVKTSDKLFLINMKNYVYYLRCPWTSDFVFERYRLEALLAQVGTPQEVLAFFKSLKVTHLLIDGEFVTSPYWGLEPAQLALFRKFMGKYTMPVAVYQGQTLYSLKAEL